MRSPVWGHPVIMTETHRPIHGEPLGDYILREVTKFILEKDVDFEINFKGQLDGRAAVAAALALKIVEVYGTRLSKLYIAPALVWQRKEDA